MTRDGWQHTADGGWQFTADLDTFLDLAGPFLRSRPAAHTVPLTVTHSLRTRGPQVYGTEPPLFGTLHRAGEVRAALFRTPPHRLYLTALTPDEADTLARHLAQHLADHPTASPAAPPAGPPRPLPGVTAEHATATAFAEAWRHRTGAAVALGRRERLYRLGDLTAPDPAPRGRPRVATGADRDLLARWYREFTASVGGIAGQDPYAWADHRVARGGVTFWETPEGEPAAMAGVTPEVAGQIRVAPVYTPPPLRRRGYAGAVTAEVSRAARVAGAAEVLLFTDLANATSNALYQRIGYRPVADFTAYDFTAGDLTAHNAPQPQPQPQPLPQPQPQTPT
ncbi:GNAT family N-acetyltransferase [Streptomyces sp. enrichment culture]|uniref:GNAT family N-acetyltransferase n=1 Tax=Streptomyces sp. enrichment culture TaxID=1795815 RepID=UPI003F5775F7